MPEQPRSIRSRQAIIDATATLIRTRGVAGTSIADIIAESGTSAGAIYHHFASKQAIVVAVADQAISWPLSALDAYRDLPASPADLFGYAISALQDDPKLGELLVQLGAGAVTDDSLGRELRAVFAQLRDALETTVASWADRNDIPATQVAGTGQLLVGLVLGFGAQSSLVKDLDTDSYLTQGRRLLDAHTTRSTLAS